MDDEEWDVIMALAKEHEANSDGKRKGVKKQREAGMPVESNAEKRERMDVLEARKREEGMARGLDGSVGWKLLEKAGFRQGDKPLPIPVTVPLVMPVKGRGLGADQEDQREAKAALQALKETKEAVTTEFHANTKARFEASKVRGQFKSALKLAHGLDETHAPEDRSAWHGLYEERLARDDRDRMELSPQEEVPENLLRCVNYLRLTYSCCFWCGVHYESPEEMDAQCPGPTEEEHIEGGGGE